MGIPDHLICLLRNLYAGQETTVRTGHGTANWFQIGKGVCQGCILSPSLVNLYAEYIMRNAGLDEAQAEPRLGVITNTQKRCLFHYRELECKSRKSRNNWSNRSIWPWSTERSRAEANRVLRRVRTGHSKCPLPTTQVITLHMDIKRWSIPKSD